MRKCGAGWLVPHFDAMRLGERPGIAGKYLSLVATTHHVGELDALLAHWQASVAEYARSDRWRLAWPVVGFALTSCAVLGVITRELRWTYRSYRSRSSSHLGAE